MKYLKYVFLSLFLIYSIFTSAENSCESFISQIQVPKLMSKAKHSYDADKFKSAIIILRQILEENPNDLPALSLLSKSHLSLGQLNSAFKYQQKILKLETTYREESYFSMAQILIAKGQHEDARFYLDVVLKQNPNQSTALGLLAESLLDQAKFEEAYFVIQKKGSINKKDPYYLLLEAQFHYLQKDYPTALTFAEKLLSITDAKLRPKNAPKAYRMGVLLKAKILSQIPGQEKLALENINEYEKYSNVKLVWVSFLKAEILFLQKRFKESASLLVEIIFDHPNQAHLILLAQLLKIEKTGFKINLNELFKDFTNQLTNEQIQSVLNISKLTEWNIANPKDFGLSEGSILSTQFWFGLRNLPIKSRYEF